MGSPTAVRRGARQPRRKSGQEPMRTRKAFREGDTQEPRVPGDAESCPPDARQMPEGVQAKEMDRTACGVWRCTIASASRSLRRKELK